MLTIIQYYDIFYSLRQIRLSNREKALLQKVSKMKKLGRVLIVEDDQKHMNDAISLCREANLGIVVAYTLDDISWDGIEGVLSDVFFPLRQGEKEDAYGIAVAAEARNRGIPCVLCTAGYHHGEKYRLVHRICMIDKVEMVDCYTTDGSEGEEKNWGLALKELKKLFEEEPENKKEEKKVGFYDEIQPTSVK